MSRIISIILLALLLIPLSSVAEGFYVPDYYSQSDYLGLVPGVSGDASGSLFNPAVWGLVKGFETQFYWNDLGESEDNPTNWALLTGSKGFGFSVQHWNFPYENRGKIERKKITDYTMSLGLGDDGNAFGIGYGWSKGDQSSDFLRDNTLSMGYIGRPCRHISYGLSGQWAMSHEDVRGILDIGVRPLGTSMLTIFSDATMMSNQNIEEISWSAGLALEPVKGIAVFGKYFEDESFSAGLNFSLGDLSAIVIPHFDKDKKSSYNTYGVRIGSPKPDILTPMLLKDKMLVKLNFTDGIKYQRYKLFDDKGFTLTEILETLDQIKKDPRISGIVLKITEDMSGSWELIWEVREKILDVRQAGKKVFVFFERGGMKQYYLASAGDFIMTDPTTSVAMLGFVMGRTFYKHGLEKLGLGVDEWRYFKYKSAFEALSRRDMSEADKEQRKALIDGWYDVFKTDICRSRQMSEEDFDHVVNNIVILNSDSLLNYGMVDTTGRWEAMQEWVREISGKGKKTINKKTFAALQPEFDQWGISDKIAIIYALGPCSMNSGINARRLEKVIQTARKNKHIKAVVLRADSPGGDILPSDIVAEELKKTAEEKPVIISQGFVAASGGYWISMYGDKIVASPWTITGSIGVIGGWIYDAGFGEKFGLDFDYTKVGDHADLASGNALPIIGGMLPDRSLTEWESQMVEKSIRQSYQDFLKKVANGREMEVEEVHEVAQGRVWTGAAGKEIGLIDELGGLEKSIEMAREAAKIKPGRKVEIIEMPDKGMINPNMFKPKLLGIRQPTFWDEENNAHFQYMQMLMKSGGRPLVLLPPDYYDF